MFLSSEDKTLMFHWHKTKRKVSKPTLIPEVFLQIWISMLIHTNAKPQHYFAEQFLRIIVRLCANHRLEPW